MRTVIAGKKSNCFPLAEMRTGLPTPVLESLRIGRDACGCMPPSSRLLISLWTGSKPTKRTWEMLCHYFSGWATLEELRNTSISPRDPPRKS
ncbi:MAG: hypothetical protein R3C18_13750 [Planctomycetaceae bacterium]